MTKSFKIFALLLFLNIFLGVSHAGVLIWGSESIQLPSLKQFNNEDFDLLKSYMRRPKVVIFQGDPMQISNELQSLLRNKYTAYVPSTNLNVDNVIDLKGDPKSNFKLIQDTLDMCSRENDNILALILTNHEATKSTAESNKSQRPKRDAADDDELETESTPETETERPERVEIENYEPVTGSVLYKAEAKTSEVAMIYSSRTPVLRINATSYNLGKAAVATVDDRGDKRQLSVAIPMESGEKVTLRFKFQWSFGYWYLNTIYLVSMYTKTYTLTGNKEEIYAPKAFSYHCSGNSMFRDEENEIELMLFDIQAQPDAARVRFDDAYDCVDFTTVPILSGLMVVSLLLVGLAVGLGALNSIKTMDKFDNSKTKQLTITTAE